MLNRRCSLVWVLIIIPLLVHPCAGRSEIVSPIRVKGPPMAPSLISPSNHSTMDLRRPSFYWTEVEGADTYTLQLDKDSSFSTQSLIVVNGLESSSFTPIMDLSLGRWFWRVKAVNSTGSSPFSQSWEFTIVPPRTAPSSDSLLVLVGVTMMAIILWYLWNIQHGTRTKGAESV